MKFAACFGVLLLLSSPSASLAAGAPQLTIFEPTLRESEGGPPIRSNFIYITGETVFFTFQIRGYQVSAESKVDIHYRIDAVDPRAVRLMETIEKDIQAEVAPEDKNWMPIVRQSFLIPPLAEPGTYKVLVAVEDRIGKREAKAEAPFLVRGRKVEPSNTLVARNFRFLRAEDDPEPLDIAAYRPGDMLWARFEMIGFQYGENNRVHVEYGVSVLDAAGKVLFSEPQAAVEQDESFYPKRYLPGILSLDLAKARPGNYVLALALRDQIGHQTAESKHEFKVE